MFDVEKNINYWRNGAVEDLETAQILIENKRYGNGLFFAHLAIEKALKAHVARVSEDTPPRIHNLLSLAKKSELPIPDEIMVSLRELNLYQLAGRYPDDETATIEAATATADLETATGIVQWLIMQLPK